ncbi:MAG: potassium-transporting ATPase subunit KdpC [Ardenticatenales bacterium]
MLKSLWTATRVVLILTVLTGAVYPAVVTVIAQVVLPSQANGSLVRAADGHVVGSRLVGQAFDDPKYFWGRPSATGGSPYNAAVSGGSNLGPTNPALTDAVKARVDALKAGDPDNKAPIPVDLVTASGSGLDPNISPAAAAWQVGRVARSRGIALGAVSARVAQHTQGRFLGIFGEPRVNVLQLNMALDSASP